MNMNMKFGMGNIRRFSGRARSIVSISLLGGLLAACSSSDGGFSDPIEDAFGDPLVAMGLKIDTNEKEIEYGPRSPLVMPAATQTQDLPAPYQAPETYGEQWPDDPDEAAKREHEKLRQAALDEDPRDLEYASKPMMPDDLNEWGRLYGRQNGAGVGVSEQTYGGKEKSKVVSSRELLDRRLDPNQLPRSEQARGDLSEPPPGYRTPAPPVEGQEVVEKKKGFFAKLFNTD